jgi:PD-(D/E)XK nuclease superfamily
MNLKEIWEHAFLSEIGAVEQRTGTNPVDWRVGGRASKANPDKENKAWWDENGLKMFENFVTSFKNNNWKIWTAPDGKPGIELGFDLYFGDVRIKAFADLVLINEDGSLTVVDLKTGTYTPDSAMQLGVYASCIEMQYGVRPQHGAYYKARDAVLEPSPGLELWTIPVLTELFAQFERGIQAEIFLPNLNMMCGSCGVKDYCYAYGGSLAHTVDPLAQIK